MRKRLLPPEVTGTGDWKATITEEQWRAVTALLGDPARKPPRGACTLLGGLAQWRDAASAVCLGRCLSCRRMP